ncbi:MAG: hypothetical protein M3170_00950 [Candidatus Dormibacteraeota bacterium]|nr:hypothetical protein [Candidatus Dormibacteraeota bacterium]
MVRLATTVRPADQEQAIEAVREWYAKHGLLPRRREWEKAVRGRPTPGPGASERRPSRLGLRWRHPLPSSLEAVGMFVNSTHV